MEDQGKRVKGLDPARAENLDACIKCGACTAQCPVTAVYPLFPGPKSMGPDAERLRLAGVALTPDCLSYCTNCKTCEVTCPSGVRVTEMLLRAREQEKEAKTRLTGRRRNVRDYILGRAEHLGRLGTVWPALTNAVLRRKTTRRLLEKSIGLSARAPLPLYSQKFRHRDKSSPLRELLRGDGIPDPAARIVYFPGCFITYNDAATGQAVVKVLEHNGFEVIVPEFHCCGVPLTTNGHFREAVANAVHNLALLQPYLEEGIPVIASCTSCGLALKDDYPRVAAPGAERVGAQTYDFFEFLWELHNRGDLREDFQAVPVSLAYHAPCHLKAQGIGTPAVRILRLIPGVKVLELDAGCCGLSGSFGFKEEKYNLAQQIGSSLFSRVQTGMEEKKFQGVVTECGGCQIQIAHGSGAETVNPVWLLAEAYGLKGKS